MRKGIWLTTICLSLFGLVNVASTANAQSITSNIYGQQLDCAIDIWHEIRGGHLKYWMEQIPDWNANPFEFDTFNINDNWQRRRACLMFFVQDSINHANTRWIQPAIPQEHYDQIEN